MFSWENVYNRDYKSNRTALHKACKEGDVKLARQLLAKGAHVNVQDTWGLTPIYLAAEAGSAGCCRAVLYKNEAGAIVDLRLRHFKNSSTALHAAARNGHTRALHAVLEYAVKTGQMPVIDLQDSAGRTALYLATVKAFEDTAAMLLDYGASVDIPDYAYKRTALHVADRLKHKGMVRILLAYGADVDAKTSAGPVGITEVFHSHARYRSGYDDLATTYRPMNPIHGLRKYALYRKSSNYMNHAVNRLTNSSYGWTTRSFEGRPTPEISNRDLLLPMPRRPVSAAPVVMRGKAYTANLSTRNSYDSLSRAQSSGDSAVTQRSPAARQQRPASAPHMWGPEFASQQQGRPSSAPRTRAMGMRGMPPPLTTLQEELSLSTLNGTLESPMNMLPDDDAYEPLC